MRSCWEATDTAVGWDRVEVMTERLKRPLVWVDCEMTGLDLTRDALIEVAVVITDENLNVVDPGLSVLITPTPGSMESMGDFVRAMHTESGLLDDLATQAIPLKEAERQVFDYITRFIPAPGKALLAGNTIGSDKAFLERDMPSVIDHLHYRVIDVSTLKELAKRWFHRVFEEAPEKHGGHRALADILESIQELKYYRSVMFPAGEGPTRAQCREAAASVQGFADAILNSSEDVPRR